MKKSSTNSSTTSSGVKHARGAMSKKGMGLNIDMTESTKEDVFIQDSLRLMRATISTTNKILPNTDAELINGFFADLLNLWETGQKLDKELRKLAKPRVLSDRNKLRTFLIWISAIQIDMGSYWIGEINKDLPKLLKALDKLDRESA